MKRIYILLMMVVGALLTCNVQAEEPLPVRIDTSKLYRGLLLIIKVNNLPVFILNRRLSEIDALTKLHTESLGPVSQCPDCNPVLRSISPDYLVIWGIHPISMCELIYVSSTANDSVGYKVHGIGGFIDKCSNSEYDLTGRKLSGPDTVPAELEVPLHKFHDEILEISQDQPISSFVDAEFACYHAKRLEKQKDYKTAIELAKKCIANNISTTSNISGYRSLAWSYFRISDLGKAAKSQRKVLSLGGDLYWDFIRGGLLFRLVNKHHESLEALKRAVELDKKEDRVGMPTQYHLGWTYYELEDYEHAIEAFTKGIPSQPDFAFIYYRRGLAYHSLGRKKEARSDFNKFNELFTSEVKASLLEEVRVKDELITNQGLLSNYGVNLSLEKTE